MVKYPQPKGDGLDIPKFLRVTQADMPARRAAWAKVKLTTMSFVDEKYKEAAAKRQEIKRQIALDRIARMKNKTAKKNSAPAWISNMEYKRNSLHDADFKRLLAEMPTPGHRKCLQAMFKFDGRRWVRLTNGQQALVRSAPARTTASSRKAPDDLATRLLGLNRAQFLKLAKANGIYKSEYEALPNDGLVRMTVGNRLRAMVRRGEAIKWTGLDKQ